MSEAQPAQINVVARSPFHVFYEGPAYSLSASNKVGSFDILPGHADFFSMLTKCTVVIDTNDEQVSFEAYNGMLTVKNDSVMLFVNM
jgi:F0F1-type ATP synthase epsilon subunit